MNPFSIPFALNGLGRGAEGYTEGLRAETENRRATAEMESMRQMNMDRESERQYQNQTRPLDLESSRLKLKQLQDEESPITEQERAMYNGMLQGMPGYKGPQSEIPAGTKKKDADVLTRMLSIPRSNTLAIAQVHEQGANARAARHEKEASKRQDRLLKAQKTQHSQAAIDLNNRMVNEFMKIDPTKAAGFMAENARAQAKLDAENNGAAPGVLGSMNAKDYVVPDEGEVEESN